MIPRSLAIGLVVVVLALVSSVARAIPPPASERAAGMLLKCRPTAVSVEAACPATVKRPLLVTCTSTTATPVYFGDSGVTTSNGFCIGPSTSCGATYMPSPVPVRTLYCTASAVSGVRCLCEGGSS